MPWREVCPMDEKMGFMAAVLADDDSMTALCEEFGISRKTGIQVAQALSGAGCGGASGAFACAAPSAVGDQPGSRRGDRGSAGRASELGAQEAAGEVS